MNNAVQRPRKPIALQLLGWFALAIAVTLVLGIASVMLHVGPDKEVWVVTGLIAIGALFGYFIGWRWYASIDEPAREAHKSSWFWGGSAGFVVAAPLAAFARRSDDAFKLPFPPPDMQTSGDYFALGVWTTFVLLLVGYGVFWLGWWIAKR